MRILSGFSYLTLMSALVSAFCFIAHASDIESNPQVVAAIPKVKKNNFMNVKIDPLFLLADVASINVDFVVSNHITVGPLLAYGSNSGLQYFMLGARGNYYPMRSALSERGWYIGASAAYVHSEFAYQTPATDGATAAIEIFRSRHDTAYGFNVAGLTGYQWLVGNHFNFTLGGGLSYGSYQNESTYRYGRVTKSYSDIYPTIETTTGYAF